MGGAGKRVWGLAALTAIAVAVAPAASAKKPYGATYANCWFSPVTGRLLVKTKHSEEAMVTRQGKRIAVVAPKRARCKGGRSTLLSTRKVKFVLAGDGITEGHLSLAGGALAPGRGTDTGDAPEVEVSVTVPNDAGTLHLDGGAGDESIRGGDLGPAHGFNLNPAAEPLAPDSDLRLSAEAESIVFEPKGGNDTIDLTGGPEFLGPSRLRYVAAFLGAGADRFAGSSSTDFVLAGTGLDQIALGAGDDAVNVEDGVAESVDCGEGNDLIQPDPLDTYFNCEQLGFVGIDG